MEELTALMSRTKAEPRPYQQRIITKTLDLFCNQGLRSVLIESPVGSGKTVMGLLIAKLLQEKLGVRVGWVAMRRNLLAQAKAENEEKGIGAEIQYLSMFEKEPPENLDMLIADEAHHDSCSSMAHIHNAVKPRFVLGLTGTPYRSDRLQLSFEKVIKDAGIATLIQDGYLSTYHHYTIPKYTPEILVDFYCREPVRWGRSLAYFHTLDECYRADALFKERGVRSDVVTGSSDRESQLEAFQAGILDVLLNCMVLSEGFNYPALQTVFARPSIRGVTVQMCGRVLRKFPALAHKQIVQCQRTHWPFPRTAPPAQQFAWTDGSWRSLQVNPKIDEVNRRVLHALASIQTQLPKLLAGQQSRRTWRGDEGLTPPRE